MEKIKTKVKQISPSVKFTILAVILIAIFSIALTPRSLQNDTFYSIKIGEHIQNVGIDMIDPFSWHENLSYTYPHWLYDLLTFLIYDAFGMDGIYIVTCILSVTLGLTIYHANKKIAKNQVFSFVITVGTMYLLRNYIAARAQLVTFILFVLTVLFIERFLETKKKRYVAGLIVIPILIANLHVAVFPFYFILYLPYIAEYIIANLAEIIIYRKLTQARLKGKIKRLEKKGESEEKLKKLKEELKKLNEKIDRIKIKRAKELQEPYKLKIIKNNNTKLLIIIMIICIFTGFLTPLGTTPYTYLIKTMQGNTTQNINEHLPMTLSNETDVICTIIIFLAVLTFTKAKIKLSDLFMLGGLCYLMLITKRQVTMFALMGSIILNKSLVNMLKIYTSLEPEVLTQKLTRVIEIIGITAVMLILSFDMMVDKLDDAYINEKDYPVSACEYIINNIDLGKSRIYNEYNYGSYMLYKGIPVFIDSRADLYAPEFSGKEDDIFIDFIDTSNIGIFYEETMKKYNITHVILYKDSKMNMIIVDTKDPKYKELYSDDNFVVYERITDKED